MNSYEKLMQQASQGNKNAFKVTTFSSLSQCATQKSVKTKSADNATEIMNNTAERAVMILNALSNNESI